jgi:hypothetical protein
MYVHKNVEPWTAVVIVYSSTKFLKIFWGKKYTLQEGEDTNSQNMFSFK